MVKFMVQVSGFVMTFQVDIWLRGRDDATTATVDTVPNDPPSWTDQDVRLVLEGMLREMDRVKNPGDADRPIALRGLSWIVNPFDSGVVIAIEITMGAVVAGPFNVDKPALEAMIGRVLAPPAAV